LSGSSWPRFRADPAPLPGEFLMRRDRERLLALEADVTLGPSLFLYRWREPTVTLGYAQPAEGVLDLEAARRAGVPVVRRPTGGRAILHADDWTYSAVVPLDDALFGGGLAASVGRLTAVVGAALAAIGIECAPAGRAAARAAERTPIGDEPACFALAVGHELTVGGRKLVGSAQRRLTRALLQQGTILAGPGYERLADLLLGDAAERERARRRLLSSTVTVRELTGGRARFEDFARVLERAWLGAPRRRPGRAATLDTPGDHS
jgi:lipoate-protein ligase A